MSRPSAAGEPPVEEVPSERHDQEAGRGAEPGVELLRDDGPRRIQRDAAEEVDVADAVVVGALFDDEAGVEVAGAGAVGEGFGAEEVEVGLAGGAEVGGAGGGLGEGEGVPAGAEGFDHSGGPFRVFDGCEDVRLPF